MPFKKRERKMKNKSQQTWANLCLKWDDLSRNCRSKLCFPFQFINWVWILTWNQKKNSLSAVQNESFEVLNEKYQEKAKELCSATKQPQTIALIYNKLRRSAQKKHWLLERWRCVSGHSESDFPSFQIRLVWLRKLILAQLAQMRIQLFCCHLPSHEG